MELTSWNSLALPRAMLFSSQDLNGHSTTRIVERWNVNRYKREILVKKSVVETRFEHGDPLEKYSYYQKVTNVRGVTL